MMIEAMPAHRAADIHALFEQAFNAGDVEAIADLYEPDAVLVVNGEPVIGRERIRHAFETLVARRGRMTLTTRTVVEGRRGLAVLHGDWVIEPATGTGSERGTRGLSTEVVRQQPNGTWLFAIDNPYTY